MKSLSIGLLVGGAVLATALGAQGTTRPFSVAETGRGYARLQDAVDAIGGGQGTIVFAPGTYRQCAIQNAGRVTFRAATPGTAILDGVACEGKAALVLRGNAASVQGLTFRGIRVPDANGAGIRLERGNLDINETLFRDSEQGILTANDPAGAAAERGVLANCAGPPIATYSAARSTAEKGSVETTFDVASFLSSV